MIPVEKFSFKCSNCHKIIHVRVEAEGKSFLCPNPECKKPLTVPTRELVEASEPTPIQPGSPAPASDQPKEEAVETGTTKRMPVARLVMFTAIPFVIAMSVAAGVYHEAILRQLGLSGTVAKKDPSGKTVAKADQKKVAVRPPAPKTPQPEDRAARKKAASEKEKAQAVKDQEIARQHKRQAMSEYSTLAEILSHRYFYNNNLIEARWKRDILSSMGPVLDTERFDDELPRVGPLLHSENEYVRDISKAIIENHAISQLYVSRQPLSAQNIQNQYNKALIQAGTTGLSPEIDKEIERRNLNQALKVYGALRDAQRTNDAFSSVLQPLKEVRARQLFNLAAYVCAPVSTSRPEFLLDVQVFAYQMRADREGLEKVPVVGNDPKAFFGGDHNLTLLNSSGNYSNCLLFVLLRWRKDALEEEKVVDLSEASLLRPNIGVSEFSEALNHPDENRVKDGVRFYYIPKFNKNDTIRFWPEWLRGSMITSQLESAGLIMFTDQGTFVLDVNPRLQGLRQYYIKALDADPNSSWYHTRSRVLNRPETEQAPPPRRLRKKG